MNRRNKQRAEQDDILLILKEITSNGSVDCYDSRKRLLTSECELRNTGTLPALKFVSGSKVLCGGGGIVFQCSNREAPTLKYALKVPRFSARDEDPTEDKTRAEYILHAPLSHVNVARLLGATKLSIGTYSPTAILVEWVENATKLGSFLCDHSRNWRQVVSILAQALDGIHHLHSQRLVHWDLKSDNILVDERGGIPKIMDIGNAHTLDEQPAKIYTTLHNAPRELTRYLKMRATDRADTRRTPIKIPAPEWNCAWVDLWMFACELNRYFGANRSRIEEDNRFHRDDLPTDEVRDRFQNRVFGGSDDARYASKYIAEILNRILSDSTPSPKNYYNSAAQVADELRYLLHPFGAAQAVEELQAIPQHVLRLPVTGNAPYTNRISKTLNSKLVRRTTQHLQLGTVVRVYPGGSHRRFEHTAGVMAMVLQYVRALFANQSEPFWRLEVDRVDVDALILAALLHDIGHMAFGHAIEEMKGLIRDYRHEEYALEVLQSQDNEKFPRIEEDRGSLRDILQNHWGLTPDATGELVSRTLEILRKPVDLKHTTGAGARSPRFDRAVSRHLKFRLLHSIIDSAIDADKLDYLLRDAHHCGVKYAEGVDTDRFFQALTPVIRYESQSSDAVIGVTEKGVLPVESILLARYHMFASVYWHHTARSYTAMLHYCIQMFVGIDRELAMQRVRALAAKFREAEDSVALEWLRNQDVRCNTAEKRVLESIYEGIQDSRKNVYRTVFELPYTESESDATRIADYLKELMDNTNSVSNPAIYVLQMNEIRKRIASLVEERIRQSALEPSAKKAARNFKFVSGELLIDIPPPGLDQVENIWVRLNDSPHQIGRLSPMADDVRRAFQYWTRRVRIFLSTSARDRLAKLNVGDAASLQELFGNALLELLPQRQFEFSSVTQDTKRRRRRSQRRRKTRSR